MSTGARTIRIDPFDSRSVAAAEAERDVFLHYGLSTVSHTLQLRHHDIRVRVIEAGKGEPVLVVPGGSGEAYPYAPMLAQVPGYRFLIVNRPGGGLSDGIDHRDVDLRALAVDTLTSVLDAFELDAVPVVANSMGGLWAFWLALDAPERVTRMVQLGCPALALGTSAPLLMRLLAVPVLEGVVSKHLIPKTPEKALVGLKMMGSRPEAIAALPPVMARSDYHFAHLPTFRDTWTTLMQSALTIGGAKHELCLCESELQQVQQPTLFIWGQHDPFGGPEIGREAADLMPRAAIAELDAGHLPFVDDPAETARLTAFFLEQG